MTDHVTPAQAEAWRAKMRVLAPIAAIAKRRNRDGKLTVTLVRGKRAARVRSACAWCGATIGRCEPAKR